MLKSAIPTRNTKIIHRRNEHLEITSVLVLHIAHIQQGNKPEITSNQLVTVKTPHHEQYPKYIYYPAKRNKISQKQSTITNLSNRSGTKHIQQTTNKKTNIFNKNMRNSEEST